jgi:transposase
MDIANIVGVSVRTVRRLQHARNDGKSIKRAPGSGGQNKKRDEAFLDTLESSINTDPTKSIRRHAWELAVAPSTILLAVNHDLGLHSYVRTLRHLLTTSLKEKRLDRCKKLVNYLRRHGSIVKICSDKKIFTVDQVYNRRNDRYLAESIEEVKGVYRTKHPAQVMVLGVLASDGKRMPPYFFGANEKVDTDVYYRVMRYHVLPWIKANYPDGNYVWQQDGAPAHTSKKIQKFCQDNMVNFWPKDFWPPSSPDLNPLDFFWWGAIESKCNATPHPNVDSLKASIAKVWAEYPDVSIQRAFTSLRPRLEAVIAAKGGHIE